MTGNQIMYLVYLVPVVMIAFGIFWVIRTIRMGRGKIKVGLTIVECVVGIALSFLLVNVILQRNNEGADIVKNAHPSSISTITYGQAIDAYCTDTSWSMFKADGKTEEQQETVVEVNGKAVYENKESDIKIQFIMSETSGKLDGNFYVKHVGLDGQESMGNEERINLLYLMFQNYASKNGISLDEETAKAGILTSQSGSESIQENSSQSSTEDATEETPEESSSEGEAEGDGQTEGAESCVEQIKGAMPSDYTTEMTFGDAFASFFKNATWSAYGDDGTMVEFTGIFILDGEECQADIIFTIEEDGSFDMSTMTCDGEERSYEDWLDLRKTVFDNYEGVLNGGESGY